MLGHGWHPRDFHVPLVLSVFWICSTAVGQSWAFEHTQNRQMCRSTGEAPAQSQLWRRHLWKKERSCSTPWASHGRVFGINDGKDPVTLEHSVNKDAAVALRSMGLVLVNLPVLQLVRVRNESRMVRGAVPGFLIHPSVGVFPYLSSYTFYSAFSLQLRERISQDPTNEAPGGKAWQSLCRAGEPRRTWLHCRICKEKARQLMPLQTGNLWSLSYVEASSKSKGIFPWQNIMKEREMASFWYCKGIKILKQWASYREKTKHNHQRKIPFLPLFCSASV